MMQTTTKRTVTWRALAINWLRRGIVLVVLIALALYFSSETDRFFQEGNLNNILQQNAAIIVIVTGLTFAMLVGGIDLSVGSVAALGGAISAGLMVHNGLPFPVSVVLTMLMGALIGAVNGSLVVYGKLPPFVATLAMMGIARGLTLVYTQGRPVSGMGDSYTFWGRGEITFGEDLSVSAPVFVAGLVVVIAMLILSQTRYGLHLYAIGGNEETARLAGVPVDRLKLSAFAVSGMLAALGGILLTARLYSAQPQAAVGWELDAIAAAVLGGVSLFGGVGNVPGAVIGGLLVGVLANGMNLLRVPSYQQQMIQGVVLVLAVTVDMLSKRLERR